MQVFQNGGQLCLIRVLEKALSPAMPCEKLAKIAAAAWLVLNYTAQCVIMLGHSVVKVPRYLSLLVYMSLVTGITTSVA